MDLQSFLRRLIWVCMAPLLAFGLVLLVIQGRAAQWAVDHALDVLMSVDAVQHVQLLHPHPEEARQRRLEGWATTRLLLTLRDAPVGRSSG